MSSAWARLCILCCPPKHVVRRIHAVDLGAEHPLVGRSAPNFELKDERLGDLLHDGRGLLLNFTASESLQALCDGRQDRLRFIASQAKDEKGLAALLVRPDGFVARAINAGSDIIGAEQSVRRWFGDSPRFSNGPSGAGSSWRRPGMNLRLARDQRLRGPREIQAKLVKYQLLVAEACQQRACSASPVLLPFRFLPPGRGVDSACGLHF